MAVSSNVQSTLSKLESSSISQSEKASSYQTLLTSILSTPGPSTTADLPAFISSLLSDETTGIGIVATRPLLTTAITSISSLPISAQIPISEAALSALAEKTSTYEEQESTLRQTLAAAYQSTDEFILAAKTLEGITLDSSSSSKKWSDVEKVSHWITICRLYIEEDDMLSAETFLNKAKTLRHKISAPDLVLQFLLSQARILDSKRDFLDASQAYHSVSQSPVLAEEDRTASLTQAITTCILAPAGPARERQLGRLFKDERAANLDSYEILTSMYLSHLVAPEAVVSFSGKLAPHQLAKTSDGSTVLAKAMVEHNLLAASKLYANLDFTTLGEILGLDAERAEEYAARMVEQKRVVGSIDQIGGVVVFEDAGSLRGWDGRVRGLIEDVERVASLAGVA